MLTVDNISVFVPDGALEEPRTVIEEAANMIGTVQLSPL